MLFSFFVVGAICLLWTIIYLFYVIKEIITLLLLRKQSRAVSREAQLELDVNEFRRQLIRMVAGDIALAERLVALVRDKHPGHKEIWYWQKTISDLEKDRR